MKIFDLCGKNVTWFCNDRWQGWRKQPLDVGDKTWASWSFCDDAAILFLSHYDVGSAASGGRWLYLWRKVFWLDTFSASMTVWKQGRRTFALTLQVARLHDVEGKRGYLGETWRLGMVCGGLLACLMVIQTWFTMPFSLAFLIRELMVLFLF